MRQSVWLRECSVVRRVALGLPLRSTRICNLNINNSINKASPPRLSNPCLDVGLYTQGVCTAPVLYIVHEHPNGCKTWNYERLHSQHLADSFIRSFLQLQQNILLSNQEIRIKLRVPTVVIIFGDNGAWSADFLVSSPVPQPLSQYSQVLFTLRSHWWLEKLSVHQSDLCVWAIDTWFIC